MLCGSLHDPSLSLSSQDRLSSARGLQHWTWRLHKLVCRLLEVCTTGPGDCTAPRLCRDCCITACCNLVFSTRLTASLNLRPIGWYCTVPLEITTCAEGRSTGLLGLEATLTAHGQAPLFTSNGLRSPRTSSFLPPTRMMQRFFVCSEGVKSSQGSGSPFVTCTGMVEEEGNEAAGCAFPLVPPLGDEMPLDYESQLLGRDTVLLTM